MTDDERRLHLRRLQLQARQDALKAKSAPQTNMVEQSMSGVNEGIAGVLGAPVDLMTGALNLGAQGINKIAGTDIQPIADPRGGSADMRALLAPTISDVEPQTTAQRFGRRIGQEAGAMAIPGGAMMRSAKSPLRMAGMEAASALGSGVAGQVSQEIAPGNETADMIASMIGGLSPMGAASAMRKSPQAPSLDSLKAQQGQAYSAVDASQARLSPENRQGILDALKGRTDTMEMDEFMHPRANRTMSRMDALEPSPRIADIEKKRRLIGRDVAGSMDPSEAAIGQGMKSEIDEYLASVASEGGLGAEATETLDDLSRGRDLTQRIKKTELLDTSIEHAELDAGGTGTGGNLVNATRQRIRAALKNPKIKRGFSEAELEKMKAIVIGTPAQNAMRQVGRFSPTTGALQQMTAGGMFAGAAATSNPLLAVPPVAGYLAKAGAEASTKKAIDELSALVRNGAPLPKKPQDTDAIRAAIVGLLAQSAAPQQ